MTAYNLQKNTAKNRWPMQILIKIDVFAKDIVVENFLRAVDYL